MAVPVFTVGEVLAASDVNAWFVPLVAYKTSATNRASNTTLSADPDLRVSLPANTVYEVRCYVSYSSVATSGMGLAFELSSWAGLGGHWSACYKVFGDTSTGTGPAAIEDFSWGDNAGNTGQWGPAYTPGDNKFHTVTIEGTAIVGSTAGTLSFDWCQANSNAAPLSVNTGSRLICQRVG